MAFATPSYGLLDLFARINRGDLQLPDFQRRYSWDVDQIRSLIVTVLRGYPVGCLMVLDTRDEAMRFRPRPITGAPDTGREPGLLLLDGQQRMTTLYQSMSGHGRVDSVDFRSKRATRRFFVDIDRAVAAPVMPDEAVFSVDEHGAVRSHFGPDIPGGLDDRDAAVANRVVPVSALLTGQAADLIFDMIDRTDHTGREEIKTFYNRILKPLSGYRVPMIRLARETAQSGVGSIFAQANSAGLQMDVFELLTAVFASEDPDFHLSEHWEAVATVLREQPVLDGIDRTEFLTAVSLLFSARKGRAAGHREDILDLSLADYRGAARDMCTAFVEAAIFLNQRCIFSAAQVPFSAQIIPLAVILARLAEIPGALGSSRGWDRLNRWFWSGVFGELYGSPAVIIRMGYDVDQVTEWVRHADTADAPEPKTVADASFNESRLLSVTVDSGVYQGIYALLMGRGARDWRTGRPFDRWTFADLEPGFHPIFPRSWCLDRGIDPVLADSVLNRTPMGKRTEVVLDGYSPARYLTRVQSKSMMEDREFDLVLASHDLDPTYLHEAAAPAFFRDRRQRLLGLVEYAMGRPANRDVDDQDLAAGEEGPAAFVG